MSGQTKQRVYYERDIRKSVHLKTTSSDRQAGFVINFTYGSKLRDTCKGEAQRAIF